MSDLKIFTDNIEPTALNQIYTLVKQPAFADCNASLLERLKARIEESTIKVSTVKAPHTYMKAVGTRELEKILEEEFGNEDTK